MRRAHKVDANQKAIVDLLRHHQVSVAVTSAAGDGFPDLVVAYGGRTALVEIKDGKKPPSKRKRTDKQIDFARTWKGALFVVESTADVSDVLQYLYNLPKV